MLYVYRNNRIIKIKPEIRTIDELKNAGYFDRHPDTKICKGKPPSIATMEKWDSDGYCRAIDGCKVELDGYCSHNNPSWLIALGLI